MSAIPIEISSPPRAHNSAETLSKQEPARIIITSVDELTTENVRGCGNDNPYN